MEDPNLFEQPRADPGAEVTPLAPMSRSPGARQPAEDSTTAAGGLGHGERSALVGNESATIPKATVVAAKPLGAEARIASEAPKSGSTEPMAPSELKAPPEASWGVVGPFVRPWSPRWCLEVQWKRSRWRRLSMLNLNPKLSESSASVAMRWWLSRRKTPPGR